MENDLIRDEHTVSIAIRTMDRDYFLRDLLGDILRQSLLPSQVVLVDDGTSEGTPRLWGRFARQAAKHGIKTTYLRKSPPRSAARARNLGLGHTAGDIVILMDDDLRLETSYIESIAHLFARLPEAVAISGFVAPPAAQRYGPKSWRFRLLNLATRLMGFDYYAEGGITARTYPQSLNGTFRCDQLFGSNLALRKSAVNGETFDGNLLYSSFGDDVVFSRRLAGRYPNGLWVTSDAKCWHQGDRVRTSSLTPCPVEMLRVPYFVYTHMQFADGRRLGRKLAGYMMQRLFNAFVDLRLDSLHRLWYLGRGLVTLLHNLEPIQRGELDSVNQEVSALIEGGHING